MSEYYRSEWAIAQNPADPRHCYPPRSDGRTLDLGCGCGSPSQVLGDEVVGVDIEFSAVELGRRWGAIHQFVIASGDRLPFASGSFERVVARVSLPYMRIEDTLREVARVLVPGGQAWLSLHSPATAWRMFLSAKGSTRLVRLFVLLNGFLLHLTGKQIDLAGKRETFQTDRAIRRALTRAGFSCIEVRRGRHFVVTAAVRERSA